MFGSLDAYIRFNLSIETKSNILRTAYITSKHAHKYFEPNVEMYIPNKHLTIITTNDNAILKGIKNL